ncbi:GNAT family N-acetyltransferase [Mycobacteroides abscessus]|uniref:GNAT family N-acetyltransferase n=1 Tax=Mycobacteroides abscessus TaxID=36809 RepID=UPI0009C7A784|nr:GNAT family protein [Mycobacteroides abscessus]SKO16278.1 Putative Gcn5-related N-acetyltransferase [Mycobacteroides abscessus subsp. massiliense]
MEQSSTPLSAVSRIEINCGRLKMIPVTSFSDAEMLACSAYEPFHLPDYQPFSSAWSNGTNAERRDRYRRWIIQTMDQASFSDLTIVLMAMLDARVVGSTSLRIDNTLVGERTVRTGSWLIRAAQGRGLGRMMRRCVLELAFGHLRVTTAYSEAFRDNHRSVSVNLLSGYLEMAAETIATAEGLRELVSFVLTRRKWIDEYKASPVSISGTLELVSLLDDYYEKK